MQLPVTCERSDRQIPCDFGSPAGLVGVKNFWKHEPLNWDEWECTKPSTLELGSLNRIHRVLPNYYYTLNDKTFAVEIKRLKKDGL